MRNWKWTVALAVTIAASNLVAYAIGGAPSSPTIVLVIDVIIFVVFEGAWRLPRGTFPRKHR